MIAGREQKPLFSMDVPDGWTAIATPIEKITDTREPLISWKKGDLTARLHSFPSHHQAIPPEAQIERWLKKYPHEPLYEIVPCSQGGYRGLLLITNDFFGAAFSLGNRGKRAFQGHPELCSDWTFVVSGQEMLNEKMALLKWIETISLAFEIPDVD